MKKLLFSALALCTALLATSCAKDAVADVTVADAAVTFGVEAPELGSRAFGDGHTAGSLVVLVYDRNGYRADLTVETTMNTDLTKEVTVGKLIKGEKYSFLFWAQSADARCFTLDRPNGKVAINYATAMNNENVDAFFGRVLNMEAKAGGATRNVTLKRPFAQINLGANDMDAFAAGAFDAATSTLVIKNVYNTLDLNDGSVAGIGAVTIPAAAIPTGVFTVADESYSYLAMNYVLVEGDKTLVDVAYTIAGIDGITADKVVELSSVPVQRNYRTNLYGALFTTSAEFNVEILPGFTDSFNNGTATFTMEGVEKIGVNEYNILNATGLTNASAQLFSAGGTFNITPDGTRAEGDANVIDMTGKEYTSITITHAAPSLTLNGNGNTIKGLNACLFAGTGSAKEVVIKDLTLDGTTMDVDDTGANALAAFIGYAGTSESITIDNCHIVNANIKGGHWNGGFIGYAAGWNVASDGPVFEVVNITNCSVKNSTFEGGNASVASVIAHGTGDLATLVKIDGIVSENNTIKNTSESKAGTLVGTVGVAGKEAAWNGKMGGLYIDNFTATGNRVNGTAYNGEKKLYGRVGSGGKLFLNGGEVTAIAALFADEENINVTLTEARTTLNAGNAYLTLGGASTKNITITGATGKEEFFLSTTYWSRISTANPDAVLTFKNCVLNSEQPKGTWDSYDLIFWNSNTVLENVVVNKSLGINGGTAVLKNVTINELDHDYYAMWITATTESVRMENCNINTVGRAIKISDQYVAEADRKVVALEINGGKFVSNSKPAIYVGNTAGANVTVKGLDITGVKTGVMITRDTEAVYADAPIYYNGNLLDAKVKVNGKGYASLKAAINAVAGGAENTTITVEKNTTITDQISFAEASTNQNLTIEGAADGSSVLDISAYNPTRWNGITVKNMTIKSAQNDYHGFQHSGAIKFVNCTIEGKIFGYGTHEVYENCTFNQGNNDYNMWVYGAANIDYINCKFIGQGRFLHVYNEDGAKNVVNVKNCQFINEATVSSGKAAVEIKIDCINGKILNSETHIDGCTLNDASRFNGLYRLSSNLGADIATSKTVKVYVDGVAVFDNK